MQSHGKLSQIGLSTSALNQSGLIFKSTSGTSSRYLVLFFEYRWYSWKIKRAWFNFPGWAGTLFFGTKFYGDLRRRTHYRHPNSPTKQRKSSEAIDNGTLMQFSPHRSASIDISIVHIEVINNNEICFA